MSGHDNEWTVATLKAHFDELRKSDEKAIQLLATDMRQRLNRMSISFDELKTSVERFHSSFRGSKEEKSTVFLRSANIVALMIAAGTLIAVMFFRH